MACVGRATDGQIQVRALGKDFERDARRTERSHGRMSARASGMTPSENPRRVDLRGVLRIRVYRGVAEIS